MFIRDVRAMSLGVTEKEAGETANGEKYNGYTCLNYVVSGEKTSRKFYADAPTLKSSVRKLDEWGKFFVFSPSCLTDNLQMISIGKSERFPSMVTG